MDKFIMYQEYNGRRLYVSGYDQAKGVRFSINPKEAILLTKKECRAVDTSTPEFLLEELWTPGMQDMLQEASPPPIILHYAPSITSTGVVTACGNTVHRDSVTTNIDETTCDACLRRARGSRPDDTEDVAPKDVPIGYWPIKGKYFHQPLEALPASYWVWVIDQTNIVHPNSYLYKYFKDNETTLRRRAKRRL